MSLIKTIEEIHREATAGLSNDPVERYVQLAARSTENTAGVTITMGQSKGWRFRCLPGFFVALWAPAVWKPVTYKFQNAALWRAIKARGLSLA